MVEARREAMVDSQLRTTGVNDPAVLAAFRAVPRERFVPAAAASRAYADTPIEITPGRVMLEPMILGLLLTNARIAPGEHVLVVGAGTGYAAALVAAMGARVTALECDPVLAGIARGNGVAVDTGPLEAGWPAAAPYDVVILDGAAAELPPALLAQVADGGRLAAIIAGHGRVGRATVGRVSGGHFAGTGFADTGAPILPGFARAPAFVF